MENNINQMTDPVFEKVDEIIKQDNVIAERGVNMIVENIKTLLDEDEEFTTKHGFLALGRTIVYLSQTFCKDADHFDSEIEKANALVTEKMMPSIMPLMKDGKIVDEDFDMEDLTIRRVLIALGCAIDYTFWRNELGTYAQKRAKLEESSEDEVEQLDEMA